MDLVEIKEARMSFCNSECDKFEPKIARNRMNRRMISSFGSFATLQNVGRSRLLLKTQPHRTRQSRVHAVHAMVLHTLHGLHALL